MLDLLSYLSFSVIISSGVVGIFLAGYIRYKKMAHQIMVCPLQSNCEAVTHSQFSRFFGVPVEVLGIAYYTLITLVYMLFLLWPAILTTTTLFLTTTLSTIAFLFSLYLTFIQAFTLKQWCTWCLLSAGLCLVIFITTVFGTTYDIVSLLLHNRALILPVHLFGIAIGLGGASLADLLFFKFLKDFRISHEEADVLHTVSQVIWCGLGILVLTGIGLYIPAMEQLNATPKFLVKIIVVCIILINGAFLNLMISPRLVNISFGAPHHHQLGELKYLRRIAFALGAISFTSWYSAFLLGVLPRSLPFNFGELLTIYLTVLGTAVIGSQIFERLFIRQSTRALKALRRSTAVAT